MGKLDVSLLRYLNHEDFRVLTAVEMGMRNHELVPHALVASIANLRHGGVGKLVRQLCRHKLLSYERGKRYDGYRLTNRGYDYLALRSLSEKGILKSIGNKIGVGKESDVFVALSVDDEPLCMKIHRLGRTCFRKLKEKRDYHQHRRKISWLYLARLAAVREFAYMKALYDRGFPVPEPKDFNRHCVVMELIQGTPLCNVTEVMDVPKLYDELMNLLVDLAANGVIHSDFNEFNIMVLDDGKPVLIDFPQMVSTSHKDASLYFDRDVGCVKNFFKRRFSYESELLPVFDDVERSGSLDVEVAASGFVKKFEEEFGEVDVDEGDDENSEIEENVGDTSLEKVSDYSSDGRDDEADESSKDQRETSEPSHFWDIIPEVVGKEDADSHAPDVLTSKLEKVSISSDAKPAMSVASTSLSTIAPEDVRKRVRRQLNAQDKKAARRIKVKGEANVVTRTRRANHDTIKQSLDGIWS
ncbi:unnamed protein product [Notodromas monacha]|uniref:Serine/threonine-protein kinase RIO2 n=1 Tax=Notodromas monacha TaxID=399045 RepID=A0A7R9GHJ1_9CRUS|nr:unnamed protein product [Notodromas monacha]CAG0921541.1 unnamed protein product [Notodromas monacha]